MAVQLMRVTGISCAKLKVKELVDDMLKKKVIHSSKILWGSPVAFAVKQNGDTRLCVDYRRLNSVTKIRRSSS